LINNFKKFGIGALHFGIYYNKEDVKKLFSKSKINNIKWIDTSPLYGEGNSEKIISELKNETKDLYIATKFGLSRKLIGKNKYKLFLEKFNSNKIENSINKSLKNLNREKIDLFQLHGIDNTIDYHNLIFKLKKIKEKGKFENFGVCNFNPSQLKKIIKVSKELNFKIDSCQLHLNFIEQRSKFKLLEICKNEKIFTIANRSLARGLLYFPYNKNEEIPSYSRAFRSKKVKSLINSDYFKIKKIMENMTKKFNINLIDFAYTWLIKTQDINSVLLGYSNTSQVKKIKILNKNVMRESLNYCNYNLKKHKLLDGIFMKPKKYFER
tara:strand:- start:12511 stop:13482 length:972 start_codon:yes stop_codon:yes gene_type:complete